MYDTSFYVRLGALLRERRRWLGLSLADVGARMPISWQQIQKYELGQAAIPVERMCELCHVLGVDTAHLLAVMRSDAPTIPFAVRATPYLHSIKGEEKQQAVMTLLQCLAPPHRAVMR